MLSLNRPSCSRRTSACPRPAAALCAINTRLAPPEVRFIVEHCGAQVLLLDPELEAAASRRLELPGLRVVRLGARVRGAARERRADAARLARQRGPPDRGRLHERHDRHAQGRRLHAPRRLPRARSPASSRRGSGPTAPTSGRCPCSTATAGASAGRVAGVRRHERRAAAAGAGGRLARAARGRHAPVRGADGADHAASRTPTRRRSSTS